MKSNQTVLEQSFLQYVIEKNLIDEQIDLYDESKQYIRTSYRKGDIGKNEWKRCIMCFVVDKDGNVLVENKKNSEKDLCSGHVKHMEVATQALLRELYEELGISIEEGLRAKRLGDIKLTFGQTENKLQCFLDIYCLFRTMDTPLKLDRREIENIELIPYKEFLEKFANDEIFQFVEGYVPITQKLKKELEDKFEKNDNGEIER